MQLVGHMQQKMAELEKSRQKKLTYFQRTCGKIRGMHFERQSNGKHFQSYA